ncbi:MAG: MFS transporter [Dorea sp.]|jgi:fucose permease|nr:MFS transporter [Dorea sp.]
MQEKRTRFFYTAAIYFMMFTASVCTTTQGVMLTQYIEYYELKSFEQGLMSAFQSGGNLAALFFLGVLLRRLRKRDILMITAVMIPCIFFMFGMRPSLFVFLSGYFVYGVVFGFLDSLASSVMVDLYPENSSLYMNTLHGIYGLGGLAGPLILRRLSLMGLEWNELLMAAGSIASSAFAVYCLAVIFSGKMSAGSGLEEKITVGDIMNFLRDKRKRGLFYCAFLYGAHQIGITVWMTRYITDYLKEPAFGAIVLSVFWVCVAVSRLVFPRFHWKNETALWAGHLVSGLAVFAGVLFADGQVMVICTAVSGLAEGMILPLTLDMGCRFEMKHTSLGSSMVLLSHYAGFIITSMIMGGIISTFTVQEGMLLPAVLSLIAAAFMFRLFHTAGKQ